MSEETLKALWESEREMLTMGMEPLLATLYVYFASLGDTPTSQKDAYTTIGLNDRTVSKNFKVLEEMKFISHSPAENSRIRVTTQDVVNFNLSTLSLFLTSLNTPRSEEKKRADGTKVEEGQFSESDIKMDSDWRTVEPILLKYFKPHQIAPRKLTIKKRFESLCELLSDNTFDFDAYCKWYRVEKYPYRKFNYGLFLYPDMIAEFRDSLEDDKYLKTTTNLENSESHKRGLEETKAFAAKLREKRTI